MNLKKKFIAVITIFIIILIILIMLIPNIDIMIKKNEEEVLNVGYYELNFTQSIL